NRMTLWFQRYGVSKVPGVSKDPVPLSGQETKSLFRGRGFATVHRSQRTVTLKVDVLTNESSRTITQGKHSTTGMLTGIAVVVVPVPKRREKRLTAEVVRARIRGPKHAQVVIQGYGRGRLGGVHAIPPSVRAEFRQGFSNGQRV